MTSTTNPDLQKERDTATFDPLLLTNRIDGGPEKTRRRQYIQNLAATDPNLVHKHISFMDRSEEYDTAVKNACYIVKRLKELNITDPTEEYWYRHAATPHETPAFGLHNGMFLPTLRAQSTPEQYKHWVPDSEAYKLIGTYAQTEMGHGTFLRGLETTATYSPMTEEFILNSPTVSSLKWWPGNLGKTTNHAVVMAHLTIAGKNYGMHGFVVQTRDMDDHTTMPGITLGDIGPKFGYGSNDNGFMKLDHVRVPRENMLAKFAEVKKDGTYIAKTKNTKLTYGTMVFIRAMIAGDAARGLAQCCTIAIRYSAVRRQSEIKPGDPEPQIMDFQTQQYKLFPLLATSYALLFAGSSIRDTYFRIEKDIQRGDTKELPELHCLSSGLKAFNSWAANSGMEVCRMSCGGHGYSQASGFPKIYTDVTPACTYEGENTVLMLQCARFLMKMAEAAVKGQPLAPTLSYLANTSSRTSLTPQFNLDSLVAAYQHRAARLIKAAASRFQGLMAKGMAREDAWNASSVDLVRASDAHCHQFVISTFVSVVNEKQNKDLQKVLKDLCQLYALYGISKNSGDFLEDGYMTGEQIRMVEDGVLVLLAVIRPNAVTLVDAFDFNDRILDSVLGRYDGQVYDNLLKFAQESPLNDTDVHPSYYKYLKPLAMSSKL
ncbi:unnamed protein product [Owenia fusiformis]|uniref:Acyl-coenzyme A oxidase n=1 Tax=Owenia fusiformis TaxID=6347 RepID=A0A8J1TQF8_OWEFU|nr:unnamed protein product [Owenia fusiformis]